jgi:hypothetical protein
MLEERPRKTIDSLTKQIPTEKKIDRKCLNDELIDPKTGIKYDPK